jgi:hypothetical protein
VLSLYNDNNLTATQGMLALEPILIMLTIYMSLVYGVRSYVFKAMLVLTNIRSCTSSLRPIQSVSKKKGDGTKVLALFHSLD